MERTRWQLRIVLVAHTGSGHVRGLCHLLSYPTGPDPLYAYTIQGLQDRDRRSPLPDARVQLWYRYSEPRERQDLDLFALVSAASRRSMAAVIQAFQRHERYTKYLGKLPAGRR